MITYTIRLLFQGDDDPRGWMVELESNDEILPTIGSNIAFNIMNRYIMFEVSMVVLYPGLDMQPVVVAKPFKTSDEDLVMDIAENIKSACDGKRLVYRHIKDLSSKVS